MAYTIYTSSQEWNHLNEIELDKICESLVIQGYKLLNDDKNTMEGGEFMGTNAPLAIYYIERD